DGDRGGHHVGDQVRRRGRQRLPRLRRANRAGGCRSGRPPPGLGPVPGVASGALGWEHARSPHRSARERRRPRRRSRPRYPSHRRRTDHPPRSIHGWLTSVLSSRRATFQPFGQFWLDSARFHVLLERRGSTRSSPFPARAPMAQVVGFIGLGIMGRPMAKNLLKAGYPLVVHSRSQGPVDELVGAGAKAASSPADVAAQVDVLITMLPNSPDVELVALGRSGIIERAKSNLLFLD